MDEEFNVQFKHGDRNNNFNIYFSPYSELDPPKITGLPGYSRIYIVQSGDLLTFNYGSVTTVPDSEHEDPYIAYSILANWNRIPPNGTVTGRVLIYQLIDGDTPISISVDAVIKRIQ